MSPPTIARKFTPCMFVFLLLIFCLNFYHVHGMPIYVRRNFHRFREILKKRQRRIFSFWLKLNYLSLLVWKKDKLHNWITHNCHDIKCMHVAVLLSCRILTRRSSRWGLDPLKICRKSFPVFWLHKNTGYFICENSYKLQCLLLMLTQRFMLVRLGSVDVKRCWNSVQSSIA